MNHTTFYEIKQDFANDMVVTPLTATIRREVLASGIGDQFAPGAKIAITGGSRGVWKIPEILRAVGKTLADLGIDPFVITAMGSHGGATEEGQLKVLRELGITEESVAMPIRSTMQTRQIGKTDKGMPVYLDELVDKADGVFLVNRIKKHTDFHGAIESGLCKMMALGLGKVKQADLIHANKVSEFPQVLESLARVMIETGKIAGGLAIVENRLGQTAMLRGMRAEEIPDTEKEILKESYQFFPRLPFEEAELLLIKEMGKNISGTGMDPSVLGRLYIEGEPEPTAPNIQLVGVLALTKESEGNACGMGLADFVTQRLFDSSNKQKTLLNTITSNFVQRGKTPIVLGNDRELIETALSCIQGPHRRRPRVAVIRSTSQLENLVVSESLLESLASSIKVLGEFPLKFNSYGGLRNL